MERKTAFGLALAIVLSAVMVSTAYAAVLYTLQKQATVYVAGSDGELRLYKDSGLSSLADKIEFGTVKAGQSKNSTVYYLKNIGAVDASVNWNVGSLPQGFAVKAYFAGAGQEPCNLWTGNIGLLAGTSCTLKFQVTVDSTVETGKSYSWTINIVSNN